MRIASGFLRMAAVLSVCAVVGSSARAADIGLFEWAFNMDGTVSNITLGDPLPAGANTAGFDSTTGLGTIAVAVTGAGPHYAALFLDHEIDEAINTFFNEYGTGVGVPAAGQSWEIDEPGYVFGDIYTHFEAGMLDNSTALPAASPDDVSMALAWAFSLGAGQTAGISYVVGPSVPAGGFYLCHTDPDSGADLYFSSALAIRDDPVVPVPGAVVLGTLGAGLVGWLRRRRTL